MPTKTIKGVRTNTAGFLGPARRGPVGRPSKAITTLASFERIYGGGEQLHFKTAAGADLPPRDNYLWHAVRTFFENGGQRVYIARVFKPLDVKLSSNHDGQQPTAAEYAGVTISPHAVKTGLAAFEEIDDISIVAAPGVTWGIDQPDRSADGLEILQQLIQHAERMRWRIAILDSGNSQDLDAVRQWRAKFDSSRAAFYYPWVHTLDPRTNALTSLPPSGFVAGVLTRIAVSKAPDNEAIFQASGVERTLTKAQLDPLNVAGINCFRVLPGQGIRLWGARTASADPEWKYVSLRRYTGYLEHSIENGTQFAAFEPNGEPLWATIRRTVEAFLHNEWKAGALLGDLPQKAYFVRCDRTTMTQDDLDNGRLICLVGVAPLRPAEFVVIRIGQWTTDHKP